MWNPRFPRDPCGDPCGFVHSIVDLCIRTNRCKRSQHSTAQLGTSGGQAKQDPIKKYRTLLKLFLDFSVFFWPPSVFKLDITVFDGKTCFLDSSTQNHAEPLWNYLKKSVLDPKCVKLNPKSLLIQTSFVNLCRYRNPQVAPRDIQRDMSEIS